ncbi:histidinol dehydrogenase [Desulfonispora thiosulfatigenes DSM 11270]|uniref:Histidinol dehydrogenase n=1 Tax=Desulfonispora thiosulfatigenes DSM 11270 TaxID=656914 RepID=A0A1W1VK33_DESTI|nr:histidinol dehydrogenase [Desulfonispora thiosulfatigenes]SMB93739.1 histidinol dehydrogenase [Desulfonispora thiosulfatigenes DSM 11270]
MKRYIKEKNVQVKKTGAEVQETVAKIIEDIRQNGDLAVRKYSKQFDNWSPESFLMSKEELEKVSKTVSDIDKQTINFAQESVRRFAQKQYEMIKDFEVELFPGVALGQKTVPLNSSGSYVPGGSYPIVASANMSITPAVVAGVKRVVSVTPPFKGEVPKNTIYAMASAGATEVYCLGGVQGVVAMALGTETIKPVDMIVGPGNKFVAEAKRQLYGEVGIDQIAGPSEALVIADDSADPEIVASDLVAQAEHGVESEVVLICLSEDFANKVIREVEKQISELPTGEIAKICWDNNGEVIVVDSIEEAAELSDFYASEHVEIQTQQDEWLLENLTNYGSLFVGEYSTVALGDKGIGTNHILPTRKAGRYTGGLWVGKFLKTLTYQKSTAEGLKYVAPYCSLSCAMEGMMGHKASIDKRLVKCNYPVPNYEKK